ncbi:hypothetical protein A2614_00935 [Candidatus Woesebacteria bacterium RIFOXYD1_FULL_40_21]|uniref:Uncharacterized protein n=2 Tax=Candidatus Woeseibacteriota TaxID=1752722 RepID=A0A1F8DIT9_9BACT|nr:MAG: hypothetical protein UT72_C0032G0008 [Candidatus Woesebacteria bacterium GW2011_GWB1_40_101]OGM88523.1 MAG: hypothetical protein A2614_00935 [Candidatus Woesebacteria bacterium RIFOXYD1_FULL_40_21]
MENQAIQNPTPEPTLTPVQISEPKAKFSAMYLVLSLFILLLLASTAFLYYQNIRLKKMLSVYQNSASPTPTTYQSPVPSTTTDTTANWKTYTDSEYKFSFMYPNDWKLNCLATELPDGWLDRNICDLVSPKALLDHGQISNGSYFVVGVSKPNPNYANFTEYLDYSSKQFGYTFKDRQINNISGKIGLTRGKETNFLFERNGHFINANWIYSENSESIDQILSTFKFTN